MIASRDEFLLLVQNWISSSAQLTLAFTVGGKTSREPISSALIVKLPVQIFGLDEAASFLTCSSGKDGAIAVGFEGAQFDFGTPFDPTVADLSLLDEREIDEAVTICLACGTNVMFFSFKR